MDTFPGRLLISLVWIFFVALFRCIENACDNISESRLKKREKEGSKRAKKLIKILKEPNDVYNSMRFIILLLEFGLAVFVATGMAEFMDITPNGLKISVLVLATLGVTLVFGVYLPKRIATKSPEKILFSLAWLFFSGYYIAYPFAKVLSFLSDLFLRMVGINPNEMVEEVTEEEIRSLVDAGSESGAIDPEEQEMIHNIFEFDAISAESIMTHRTDVAFLWMEDLTEWEQIIDETNHSIYPVCNEKVDDIIGILYSRDFLRLLRKNDNITPEMVEEILRPPYFVPESIKANDLFRNMQENKSHFAVVLDEYGGLGGIITISDLLEEIVGDLDSEFDEEEEEEITQLDQNTWKILGSTDIDLVSETLDMELPIEEFNTFAGMILAELGSIPDDGTTYELEAYGLGIKITKIEDHRIDEAIVCKLEPKVDEE